MFSAAPLLAQASLQFVSDTHQTVFQSIVNYSFTFTFIGMVVTTVYCFLKLKEISPDHRGSLVISGCITLAASLSYLLMRAYYIPGQRFPVEFRYADWTITTPLLLMKFISMLDYKYVKRPVVALMILADLEMIITGYIGIVALEHSPQGVIPLLSWVMFAVSMVGWFVVIGVLMGPVRAAIPNLTPEIGKGVKAMLVFPTLFWAIYPAAYLIRALGDKSGFPSDLAQLLQNCGDFVNKVVFGVLCVAIVRAATLAADRRALRSGREGEALADGSPELLPGRAGIEELTIDDPSLPELTRASMRATDDLHRAETVFERPVRHL